MIVFVCTASHTYTHAQVAKALPAFRILTYPVALARRSLPRGTYIFSDYDRLNFWQLELAARLCRQLRAAGCRVLNDPARALQRLGLLRRLDREGVNSFRAWPAEEAEQVDRFPVFVRTQAAHRGVLSDLLQTPQALAAAVEALLDEGYPRHDLMVVEYRAEPLREDLFRKLAVHRIGDAYVAAPCVHERKWAPKYGELGVAGQDLYDDDHRIVRDNPFAEVARRAFELAGIEYGRMDFGLVGDRPEIYEINSNPHMARVQKHPFPIRLETSTLSWERLLAAIEALDTPDAGPAIRIERHPALADRPRRLRLAPGYQWMP